MGWIAFAFVSVALIAALIALWLVCSTNGEIRKGREEARRDLEAAEFARDEFIELHRSAVNQRNSALESVATLTAERDAAVAKIKSTDCLGCGKPLLQENSWVCDGCPCNSGMGCNDGVQVISDWRWTDANRLRNRIETLNAELSGVTGQLEQAKKDRDAACEESHEWGRKYNQSGEAVSNALGRLRGTDILINAVKSVADRCAFSEQRVVELEAELARTKLLLTPRPAKKVPCPPVKGVKKR